MLRAVAERIARALPPVVVEVVLTGSVSRGVADELSDIEMLLVTSERLTLDECYDHARRVGLVELDSWGQQGTAVSRVFGYLDGVPIELTWWPRQVADEFTPGDPASDALVHGVSLRTVGFLAKWQEELRVYPDELAALRIEEAALTWGGFHPSGFLTIARPGERLPLVERLLDDASRVLAIVYALNRVWPPTSKRLADRVEELSVRPDRLAERIREALTEPDPLRAIRVLGELQIDTVRLAPSGPNIDRARRWLPAVVDVVSRAADQA
ncbi:MAG TPA: nucleotidyltransferase domain-containing protein [Gaiellaceae bacterium]|jgi:predicted nucleotidyltransferase|nr:nucleotidyltransferase domain-containing protein [Gaiellaceae bacterium]